MKAKTVMDAARLLPALKRLSGDIEKLRSARWSMEAECSSSLTVCDIRAATMDEQTWCAARDILVSSLERNATAIRSQLASLGVGSSPQDLAEISLRGL